LLLLAHREVQKLQNTGYLLHGFSLRAIIASNLELFVFRIAVGMIWHPIQVKVQVLLFYLLTYYSL